MCDASLRTAPRYIPVAEYVIGACSCFRGPCKPNRTVVVKADSKGQAWTAAHQELKPSTIEHLVHVETRPNPGHVADLQARSML